MATPAANENRPQPEPLTPPSEDLTFPYVCLVLSFLVTVLPITSSLWLDETATYWVIKDGLKGVFARSWMWSGQSALYYLTAWAGHQLAARLGPELALRVPSLLSTALAAFLLYRMGKHLANRNAGMMAALAFICMPGVSFAAIDARPYALGLMLLIASMLSFIKWLDRGRPLDAVLYVITSVLVVYAHYLLALALFPQLIVGLKKTYRFALAWLIMAVLCLPLTGQLMQFYANRHLHTFAGPPDVYDLFAAIAPPLLAAVVLLAGVVSQRTKVVPNHISLRLMAGWLMFPPAFLFGLSLLTDTRLFVPRYVISCVPAAALLAGYAIARLSAARTASVILLASLVLGVVQCGPVHGNEDWRAATKWLNAHTTGEDVVFVMSGFVEGTKEAIDDPRLQEVLYSPQAVYPAGPIVRLPYSYDDEAIPTSVPQGRRVFLLTRRAQETAGASIAYEWRLKHSYSGFRSERIGDFGLVALIKYER